MDCRHTLLPLDDSLYALQASIPHLSRSAFPRCLHGQGISQLPEVKGEPPERKKFKPHPTGDFHVDIAQVRTEEGKRALYVTINCTSKFAYAERHTQAGKMEAAQFLRHLIQRVPYTSHTVLTDNDIQFTNRKTDR